MPSRQLGSARAVCLPDCPATAGLNKGSSSLWTAGRQKLSGSSQRTGFLKTCSRPAISFYRCSQLGGRLRRVRRNLPRASAKKPTHPCKEHGVPAPTKQNPGCPKPAPSLGWKAPPHPIRKRSWGWGEECLLWHFANRGQHVLAGASHISPEHLGLDRLGVQRGEGCPLCRAQPWQRCSPQGARTVLGPSLTFTMEPPWPKTGWRCLGVKGLPGPPRAVPRGQAQ